MWIEKQETIQLKTESRHQTDKIQPRMNVSTVFVIYELLTSSQLFEEVLYNEALNLYLPHVGILARKWNHYV